MSDQSPEQVRRFVGDPALPEQEGGADVDIEDKTGTDQSVVEDAAAAAVGAPAEEASDLATGERSEDRPQT
jgi:hypothetical protein